MHHKSFICLFPRRNIFNSFHCFPIAKEHIATEQIYVGYPNT